MLLVKGVDKSLDHPKPYLVCHAKTVAAGGWQLVADSWRLTAGGWQLVASGWRLATLRHGG